MTPRCKSLAAIFDRAFVAGQMSFGRDKWESIFSHFVSQDASDQATMSAMADERLDEISSDAWLALLCLANTIGLQMGPTIYTIRYSSAIATLTDQEREIAIEALDAARQTRDEDILSN